MSDTDNFERELKWALKPFRIPYSAWGIVGDFAQRRLKRDNPEVAFGPYTFDFMYGRMPEDIREAFENRAIRLAARYKRIYPCMVKESK